MYALVIDVSYFLIRDVWPQVKSSGVTKAAILGHLLYYKRYPAPNATFERYFWFSFI